MWWMGEAAGGADSGGAWPAGAPLNDAPGDRADGRPADVAVGAWNTWPARWTVNTRPTGRTDESRDRRGSTGPGRQDPDRSLIDAAPRAGAVVVNDARRVLLLWRRRWLTGTWAYEIPIGGVLAGEHVRDAAAREVEEETGWRPGPLIPLLRVRPSDGLAACEHHIFRTDRATYRGPAPHGATAVEWVSLDQVRGLIERRRIVSATTAAALLMLPPDV
jgi:8-oxo-dGTP pyrophosphatase MutT (NUDIX family)